MGMHTEFDTSFYLYAVCQYILNSCFQTQLNVLHVAVQIHFLTLPVLCISLALFYYLQKKMIWVQLHYSLKTSGSSFSERLDDYCWCCSLRWLIFWFWRWITFIIWCKSSWGDEIDSWVSGPEGASSFTNNCISGTDHLSSSTTVVTSE